MTDYEVVRSRIKRLSHWTFYSNFATIGYYVIAFYLMIYCDIICNMYYLNPDKMREYIVKNIFK